MEKLSICRICLSDEIPLRSIIKTHLQEMYESLTKTPFVADDIRPVLVCHLCCARLKNSLELKEKCLQSEKLFAELLQSNVQVNLQIMPDVHLSTEHVIQMTPNVFNNAEVKQETAEEHVIQMTPNVFNNAEVKQETAEDTRDDRSTSSDSQNNVGTEYLLTPDPDVDNATPIFEEDDHVQSSDTEDIISVAVVKAEPSDVTGSDTAVEQEDADLYHSALGLHTECDIPLDIVKEEPDDADTGAPRLAAQMYRNDTLLSTLKTTDQIMDKLEEPKRETGREIKGKPVKKNKIVDTRDEIGIRLRNNTQNNCTFAHSGVHKEMSENKSSAVQSVHSSSSNKLTPLLCDICQKCFKYKSELIRHIRIHTGEKPYKCNVCKKCFSEKSSLNVHMLIHTGEKPYECNICKKCFYRKTDLDRHVRSHLGEKPYKCNVCKKCFVLKFKLNIHTRIHTNEKLYKCDLCKKCFREKGALKIHMRIHTGEKPYECNICEKCFCKKSDLDRHVRSHLGEKPYKCNVCKKCFVEKSKLNIHTRIHTDEKLYKCDICKKCFREKGTLNVHMRIHTDEKPYECNICKKCFTRKYNLNFHTRTHTEGKP